MLINHDQSKFLVNALKTAHRAFRDNFDLVSPSTFFFFLAARTANYVAFYENVRAEVFIEATIHSRHHNKLSYSNLVGFHERRRTPSCLFTLSIAQIHTKVTSIRPAIEQQLTHSAQTSREGGREKNAPTELTGGHANQVVLGTRRPWKWDPDAREARTTPALLRAFERRVALFCAAFFVLLALYQRRR